MSKHVRWRNTIPYTTDESVVALARGVVGNAATMEVQRGADLESAKVRILPLVPISGEPEALADPDSERMVIGPVELISVPVGADGEKVSS